MIDFGKLFSPSQKLMLLFASSLLSVTIDNSRLLGGYLCFCLILILSSRIPLKKLRIWLAAVILTFWGTLLSQSLFYTMVPRTVILQVIPQSTPVIGVLTGGVNIYKEGVEYGLVQGMRFVISLTCGLFICFTTESKDLLRAAIRLKMPLNFSFMLSVALRFIPLIVDETRTVMRAQKLRGFSIFHAGCVRPMHTAHVVLRPILVNAIRRSSMLSLSVESRHFGNARSAYTHIVNSENQFISITLGTTLVAVTAALAIKGLCFLYIANYFYASWLRPIYALGEQWL